MSKAKQIELFSASRWSPATGRRPGYVVMWMANGQTHAERCRTLVDCYRLLDSKTYSIAKILTARGAVYRRFTDSA